jgi:hypothetical protein
MVSQIRISKTGAELFKRLVIPGEGDEMLEKCDAERVASRATQIGANHVWEVFGRERYYLRYGEGKQGGPGSGRSDPPRDEERDVRDALKGTPMTIEPLQR